MTTFDEIPDISTRPDGLGFLKLQIGGKKLKLGDIAWVSDKLATTQGAGLPLYRSLGMLARMKAGTPTGDVLTDVVSRMNDGASFTNSIRAHEDALGSLPCALIEAGEQSGTLQRAFDRISHNAEVQIRLRRKIRAAMSYPLIVLSISLVLIFVLLTFVVPQFATLFKNANESLPWLTKDLLWASKHVAWGFGIIIAIGAIIWTVMHFKMLPESSLEQLERVKYGVPVFGGLAKKTAVARTSSTLADLIAAGVPLLDSCRLAASTSGSLVLQRALEKVGSRIAEGSTFSRALAEQPEFPEMLVQFVAVGEESGALATLMTKYSETAEEEVAASADALTALLNPVMIIIVGAIVGTCIIGLYLPILNLGNTIK